MKSSLIVLLLVATVFSASGCYYLHLAKGQTRLLMARRPIPEVLADSATPSELSDKLERVSLVRRFAEDLGLEVGKKYTSYATWPGDRIVTNLVATRAGEIEAVENCFPVVGCVPYRGFFELDRAEAKAEKLRSQGMDVCLTAVSAYSTLGWLNDPVTDPMLRQGSLSLVETLLHELVHATVYIADDPHFNEGVASFIGQEAAVHFFDEHSEQLTTAGGRARSPRDRMRDNRDLAAALVGARAEVGELYREGLADADRAQRRVTLERQAREHIATLPMRTRDARETRALAQRIRLNDACLALRETYSGDQERFAAALQRLGGSLEQLVAHLKSSAKQPDPRAAFFETLPSAH